jgi:hypothetical protein
MLNDKIKEALNRILSHRWISRGYGQYNCSSCGALRSVDYGDHEQPKTEKREPCSKNCPWQIVEDWLKDVK